VKHASEIDLYIYRSSLQSLGLYPASKKRSVMISVYIARNVLSTFK